MTNKEKYIKSFSGVEPSDEIKERIINMTISKRKLSFKSLAITFAVLMLLAMAMITANAATDGELLNNFIVLLNGEEVDSGDYILKEELVTDENGETQNRLSFSYNGENGDNEAIVIMETENEVDDFKANIKIAEEDESVYYQIIE